MSPLSDGYKPLRPLVPIEAIGAALDRGKAHLLQETNHVKRLELEQLLYYASRGSTKALDTLWALGPVDRNRYTPSGPNYLAREEAYQKQQRENAAALAVTRVRELYNSLVHGDTKTPRTIPYDLAKRHGLFTDTITAIQQEAEEKVRLEQAPFWEQAQEEFTLNHTLWESSPKWEREKAGKAICASKLVFGDIWARQQRPLITQNPYSAKDGVELVRTYELLHENPRAQALLSPYYTARFAPPWAGTFPDSSKTVSWLLEWAGLFRRCIDFWDPPSVSLGTFRQFLYRKGVRIAPDAPPHVPVTRALVDGFEHFVRQYQEGAIVVLVLLMTLRNPGNWWRSLGTGYRLNALTMMWLPTIANREPLEILLLLGKLDELLLLNTYFKSAVKGLEEWGNLKDAPPQEIHLLSELLAQSRDERVRQGWWRNSEKLVRTYLMARASDSAYYGQSVADRTFPHPTLQGVSPDEVADMVAFMVNLLQEEERRRETERWQIRFTAHQERTQAQFNMRFGNKPVPVPVLLPPRVLSEDEIEVLKAICRKELGQGEK